jgi:hypothetical protein
LGGVVAKSRHPLFVGIEPDADGSYFAGAQHGNAIREALARHGIKNGPLVDGIFFALHVFADGSRTTARDVKAMTTVVSDALRLQSQLETLRHVPCAPRIEGLIDDAIEALSRLSGELTAETKANAPERRRPTTGEGAATVRLFNVLRDFGVDDLWKCSEIIAEVFRDTGRSTSSAEKLTRAIYDRLKRQVR